MKRLLATGVFLGAVICLSTSFAYDGMYQDDSGRWVNSAGGNI